MQVHVTTLERAFELAASGRYDSVSAVRQRLLKEGYAVEQLTGRNLLNQLNTLIRARTAPPS
jgi:hypothetical protein